MLVSREGWLLPRFHELGLRVHYGDARHYGLTGSEEEVPVIDLAVRRYITPISVRVDSLQVCTTSVPFNNSHLKTHSILPRIAP